MQASIARRRHAMVTQATVIHAPRGHALEQLQSWTIGRAVDPSQGCNVQVAQRQSES